MSDLAERAHEYIEQTSIPGLFKVKRPSFEDDRGFFKEIFHLDELESILEHPFKPVQSNHACSKPQVLRGLHAENWNKLIYPMTGESVSVIVDIRPENPTFGKFEIFEFSNDDRYALFLPKGVANSVCVTGLEDVHYLYLVDAYYDGSDTRAIAWDDPDLAINWPIKDPILSERDRSNPRLRELFPEKF